MQQSQIIKNNQTILVVYSPKPLLTDVQAALDFLLTVTYETGSNRIAVNQAAVVEDFFVLSTRLAGEILQKFITYQTKLAIYGDFSGYTSKPLRDFIYESNQGNDIFFTATQEEAVAKLSLAK